MKLEHNLAAPLVTILGVGFVLAVGAAYLSAPDRIVPAAVVAGIGVVTLAALWLVFQTSVVSRLGRMSRTLKRAGLNNFVVRCETGEDQIGLIGRQVNRLLEKLTDLSVNVIDTDRELQWTQKELGFKEEVAEKGRLLLASNVQLEVRLKELSLLFSTSRTLSSSIDPETLIANFSKSATTLFEVDRFAIMIYDERKKALVVAGTSGFKDAAGRVEGMRFYPGEGVSGTVLEKKTMLYVRDLEKDARFLHFRGKLRLVGSAVALPLLAGENCVGVMLLNRERREAFSFDDMGLLHIVANQVAGAVGNALLYQKTRELATHDELTGLHNRRMLERRLGMEWERSRRFDTTLSCIMVDVDHFKTFNDRHGHLVGDEVLRQAGKTLGEHVRKVDTVARFGGEEFAILLPRTEKDEASAVAEKLRQSIGEIFVSTDDGATKLSVSISAGVASTGDAPQSAKQLIDMADHALLIAKNEGRNRVVEYGNGVPRPDAAN